MKILTFHLRGSTEVKRIMKESLAQEALDALTKGLSSRRKDPILEGEDVQGNPFYIRIREVVAVTMDNFEIQDF